jgi:hypothetical protein
MAAIIAVAMIIVGSPKEPSIPAITTSTNSTTAPGTATNTVSETSTACLFFFRRQGAMSHIVIFDANIRLPVRAPRHDVDMGAAGFGHRRRC